MTVGDDLAKVAAAVTGPGTPDAAKITRTSTHGVWVQTGVAIVVVLIAGAMVYALGWGPWPKVEAIYREVIKYQGWALMACILILGGIALSPWFTRVSASAGLGRIEVSNDPPR